MRKNLLATALFALATLLAVEPSPGIASPAATELPRIRSEAVSTLAAIPVRRLPAVNSELLEDEDNAAAGPATPVRVAAPSRVHLRPGRGGSIEELQGGGHLWRLRVSADGASDLQFGFRRFHLPPGATLHVSSESYDYTAGPWTSEQHTPQGKLWTPAVPGDRAFVELYIPAGEETRTKLVLSYVGRGYRDLVAMESPLQRWQICEIDVACPEGTAFANEIRSVARYTFTTGTGSYLCTGTLIMDAIASYRAWFLTASHCAVTKSVSPTVVTYWNYQAPTCGSFTSGSVTQTMSGATFRASREDVDFRLLELSSKPPDNFYVFYAGWDRTSQAASSSVGIHHPSGGEKSICVNSNAVTSIASCIGTSNTQTHWKVDDWEEGITESGSSGSGLFSAGSKKLVGFLSGGSSSCNNRAGSDCYGKFTVAWDGPSAASRLRDWLDPTSSGALNSTGGNPPSTEKPVAPAGLKAVASSASTIHLTWNDKSGNETGFKIQRQKPVGGSYSRLTTTNADSTAYNDTGLPSSSTYCYQVQATNLLGDSPLTAEACATTESTTTTTTLPPVCGDANADGVLASTDGLAALKAAVGAASRCTPARCDVDSSGEALSSDALRILRKAVGQSVTLNCPA